VKCLVCLLVTTVSLAKTEEPIEMRFEVWIPHEKGHILEVPRLAGSSTASCCERYSI